MTCRYEIIIDDLWARLEAATPNAKVVRQDKAAREIIEKTHIDYHYDDRLNRTEVLSWMEMSTAEVLGTRSSRGLLGDIECRAGKILELDFDIRNLAVSCENAKDPRLRDATQALEEKMRKVNTALIELCNAAEDVAGVFPRQRGGRGVATKQARVPTARAIAENAAHAWQRAGLPLGGPGRHDAGFADFMRSLYLATTADRRGIPSEGAVLAELRKSLPSKRFR